jgi:protein-disulfide isomerase
MTACRRQRSGNVTLVEFFDYNCPYCRAMTPVMAKAEAADPQVRIVYKEFPMLGQGSAFAAKAALAANKQGKYVAFHRALFQVRGQVDEAKVIEVAASVGLDVSRLKSDMQDAAINTMLAKDLKLAQTSQINGTLGFVTANEVKTGAMDLEGLQALIVRVRSSKQVMK